MRKEEEGTLSGLQEPFLVCTIAGDSEPRLALQEVLVLRLLDQTSKALGQH